MCLKNNPKVIKELFAKIKNTKHQKILAYKVVEKESTYSQHRLYSPIYMHEWFPGINKSNSKVKKIIINRNMEIERGIHVYLNLPDAKREMTRFGYLAGSPVVLPVWCYAKDLIAANRISYYDYYYTNIPYQAVFKEVTVTKRAYEKALRNGH